MSFKHYITSHFAGCRLLAETEDVYRDRKVKVFMIPGNVEHVGVCDGTDAWVAPVVADPFRVDVRKLIMDIQSGGNPAVVVKDSGGKISEKQLDLFQAPQRRKLTATAPAGKTRRSLSL